MTIGEVTGKEPGQGARFNDGKPPYRFIPWGVLAAWAINGVRTEAQTRLINAARQLGRWEFREGAATAAIWEANRTDLDAAAQQLLFGASKYDDWNWALGMPWSVPSECAKRHFVKAIELAGSVDDESGVTHEGAFWCNVVMLTHLSTHYQEGDDRPGYDGKQFPYETLTSTAGRQRAAAEAQRDAFAAQQLGNANPFNFFR